MDGEQINKAINLLKSIAKLHEEGLSTTEAFPNWNACLFSLTKLKKDCDLGCDISQNMRLFMDGHFAELEQELKTMIAPSQLAEANELYQEMRQSLSQYTPYSERASLIVTTQPQFKP